MLELQRLLYELNQMDPRKAIDAAFMMRLLRAIMLAIGSSSALNNFSASADPTVNDDSNAGYSANSLWYNTVNGFLWVCQDASPGAAVWMSVVGNPNP